MHLRLTNIQEFSNLAFPDQKVTFHAKPTIILEEKPVLNIISAKTPTLYQEETVLKSEMDRAEKRALEETQRFLDGLLPTIDVDLETVTEEQLAKLSEHTGVAKIDVTFYSHFNPKSRRGRVNRRESMIAATYPQLYSDFQIMLEGHDKPVLNFFVITNFYGQPNCDFRELYFDGSPEQIERIIEAFTQLMKQTPNYRHSIREK